MNTSNTGRISDKFSVFSENSKVVVVEKGRDIPENKQPDFNITPEIQRKIDEELRRKSSEYEAEIAELKNQYESRLAVMDKKISAIEKENELLAKSFPAALSEYFKKLEDQIKEEICEVSFLIAELIIKEELTHKDILKNVIKEALNNINTFNNVQLYLPSPYVEKIKVSTEYKLPPGIEIIPDNNLQDGELILKTPQGFIDATIKERLKNLKEAFFKAVAAIQEKSEKDS